MGGLLSYVDFIMGGLLSYVKNRNVLSNQFIGLRAYKDKQLKRLKSTGKQRLMNLIH
jgi:hydroxylamine reductase (hybrid-cluster protein)